MAQSRAQGILLGLACGDTLGRPVEFQNPNRIKETHGRVTEMLAHGTHGQPAGTITDDTEMALCIGRSLAEHGTFEPKDVAARFVEWKRSGPFDIGIMTSSALQRIQNGEPWDEAGHREWEASVEPITTALHGEPVDISLENSGYVVTTLQAGLSRANRRECCRCGCRRGDDGRRYGYDWCCCRRSRRCPVRCRCSSGTMGRRD
nr:ADP-ribosylglycohydrolase family protein [Natrinema sp. CBA1119]